MANLRTGRDIIENVLFRLGERTDGSSPFQEQIVANVNRAWHTIQAGGADIVPEINEVWHWSTQLDPQTIVLEPQIEDAVTTTLSSTTVTFDTVPSPLVDTVVDNWWLKVEDTPEVYRIASHTAATATATLDTAWYRTAVTSKTCFLFKTDYTYNASSAQNIQGPMRVDEGGWNWWEITEVSPSDLNTLFPLRDRPSGVPVHFARLGIIGSTDDQRVRFSHGGKTDGTPIHVNFDLEVFHSDIAFDATEVPMPIRWRPVIADYAAYLSFLDTNDARAPTALQLARAGVRAMARENRNRFGRSGKVRHIHPRLSSRYHERRVLRTESGLIIG